MRARLILLWCLWTCPAASVAETAPTPVDPVVPRATPIEAGPVPKVLLSGGVDALAGGPTGGQASVDVIVPHASGRTFSTGFEFRNLDTLRWGVMRAGVGGTVSGPWYGEAQIQVGPGRQDDRRFTYWKLTSGLGRRIGAHLGADATYTYIDIDRTQGHLARAGLWWAPLPTLQFRIDGAHSLSGDLDTRTLGGRIDARLRGAKLFAGGSWGETRAELIGLPGTRGREVDTLREAYLGATVPWRGAEIGLVASQLWSDATDRTSVQLLLGIPLAGLRRAAP